VREGLFENSSDFWIFVGGGRKSGRSMVRFVSTLTAAKGWRFHIHGETIWILADILPFSTSPAFSVPSHFVCHFPVELNMLAPFFGSDLGYTHLLCSKPNLHNANFTA